MAFHFPIPLDRARFGIQPLVIGIGLTFVVLIPLHGQTLIPASSAAPSALIDTSSRGFLVRMNQLPDGVQRDPRHSVLVVEQQLARELIDPETSEPFLNEIDDADDTYERTDDGGFIVDGPINFNQDSDPAFGDVGESGNFIPDDKYPGIPGFGNGGGWTILPCRLRGSFNFRQATIDLG